MYVFTCMRGPGQHKPQASRDLLKSEVLSEDVLAASFSAMLSGFELRLEMLLYPPVMFLTL